MANLVLKGCGTALVTPFKFGQVDFEAYAGCIQRQVAAGVDFLVPLATTSETPTLSREEKTELLLLTRAHAGGLPIVAGCGSNSVEATKDNIALLEKCGGADAYLVVVPFYNKPTQEGMYQYFKLIAKDSPKPVVIYNVPGRTGANMSAATALRLAADCPNIIGIKEASGSYTQVSEILRSAPESFSVLSGDDDMTFAFMSAGAKGVISVASNAAPELVSELTSAALQGKWQRAKELHHQLSPLFRACFVESNPVPVKAAMAVLGQIRAEVRLPLTEATQATKALMESVLAALGQGSAK